MGKLLVVVGGFGIPSIVRVEPDGSWTCVAGIFCGRKMAPAGRRVVRVCEDGDVFEDVGPFGVRVDGGRLVDLEKES